MLLLNTFEDVRRLVYEIKQRENVLLDYKSGDNPKDAEGIEIAKDVSSFADQNGGFLIYGVRADAAGNPIEINGISNPEILREKIIKSSADQANLNPPIFLDPKILNGEIDGEQKWVVVVSVEESINAPHFYRGTTTFWMRAADHNQAAEGTPNVMNLLQNRREKMEERKKDQLDESHDLAMRWMVRAYHPHHKPLPQEYVQINAPHFSFSLQPKMFNESLIDIRKIRESIGATIKECQKKFKWPTSYYYSFFEFSFESYALTFVSRWHENVPQETKAIPNTIWTSASSTGLLFHFEDMPYKHPVPQENGITKPQKSFEPMYFLRKSMAFLLFAKEYYSIVDNSLALTFKIECDGFLNAVPLYRESAVDQRRMIENHFVISRSFTTLEMNQEFIERLIISDIVPELLININFMIGHTFDLNDVNSVKRILAGQ